MKVRRDSFATKIGFRRPRFDGDQKLFYNEHHNYDPDKYDIFHASNVLTQIRLYRFFLKNAPESQFIEKAALVHLLAADTPRVTKFRISRTLALIVEYRMHMQRNPGKENGPRSRYFYRWGHPMEPVYGLEYLMLSWFPRYLRWCSGEDLKTAEQYEEELKIFADQSPEEDLEYIRFGIEKTALD